MTILVAKLGDVELTRVTIERPVVTVGRGPSSDVCIKDPSLSRAHVRLERQRDGYRVRDLGSANGTRKNGEPVSTPVVARHGDRLELGNITITLEDDGGAPDVAVARRRKTPVLVVTADDGQRSSFALVGDAVVIGRSDDADVSLPSTKISRSHAKLQRAGGFFILADLGSQNGTWARNRRLDRPLRLAPGDVFFIEPYTLELDERDVELVGEAATGRTRRPTFFLSPDELDPLDPSALRTGQIEAPDDDVFEEPSLSETPAARVPSPAPEPGLVRVLLVSGRAIEHPMISPVATLGDTADCDLQVDAGALPTGPSLVLVAAEGGRLAVVRLGRSPVLVQGGLERDTALLEPGDVAVFGPLEIHWR